MAIISFTQGSNRDTPGWRERYRYAAYEHKRVFDSTRAYTRLFIILKTQYNTIVHFTGFHNYIDAYAKGVCIPLTLYFYDSEWTTLRMQGIFCLAY
jgi:hypothetical protein